LATSSDIEARIGHSFGDKSLLRNALTHPSHTGDQRGRAAGKAGASAYERLEFLGDRVLGLVVADMLLHHFPDEPEGDLARRHTALVREAALARVAGEIDLGAHLRLSQGEEGSGGREKDAILSDAAEALIGAMYLDGGLAPPAAFIRKYWTPYLDEHVAPPQDSKTALQEWAQARGLSVPVYEERARTGPDHAPEFVVAVCVDGYDPVEAAGASKRKAEKAAATALLASLTEKD